MIANESQVLLIDDDRITLRLLKRALDKVGIKTTTAEDGLEGLELYQKEEFDLVLVDLFLPDIEGIEVIHRLKEYDDEASTIMITGHGSVEKTVKAMKAGAEDFLLKPLDLEHFTSVVTQTLNKDQQPEESLTLDSEPRIIQHGQFEGLVGTSKEMQSVCDLIRRVSQSNANVLIQGETGTGKELAARAIHHQSDRRDMSFVSVNCGALSESLLESELFGHERGAFTGAFHQKKGLLERASGGTLFLDEVEEMSPALQVKLLRVLQEREVVRVGGDRAIPLDFRVIAATNVDLDELVGQGAFRRDLFYRLNVIAVDLPALRARRQDIPLLASHFLMVYADESDGFVEGIAPEAMQILKAYAWPGNVRELENVIQRAVLLGCGEEIIPEDLPPHIAELGNQCATAESEGQDLSQMLFKDAREEFERQYLVNALAKAEGQVAKAASEVGIHRRRFYEKMKRYGISRDSLCA